MRIFPGKDAETMTVQDFYQLIDRLAPFDGQEEYDNSGFLVGSGSKEVSSVLLALDVTDSVIDDAVRQGAQLIITHRISDIRFKGSLFGSSGSGCH